MLKIVNEGHAKKDVDEMIRLKNDLKTSNYKTSFTSKFLKNSKKYSIIIPVTKIKKKKLK